LNEALAALDLVGGSEGLKAVLLAKQADLPHLKHGDVTLGQLLAGRAKLADAVWEALLREDTILALDVPGESAIITTKEKDRSLVDRNGRFIPSACGITAAVVDADWERHWIAPNLDKSYYLALLRRLEYAFEGGFSISAAELQERATERLKELAKSPRLANLVKGKYACPLVTVIPFFGGEDYGKNLETCIGAVERAFLYRKSNRKFTCWWGKWEAAKEILRLKGAVRVHPKIRHNNLVEQAAKGCVPGLFFPSCCQGFSPDAMFQLEHSLPKRFRFCTAGGIDTCAVWAGNIDTLFLGEGAPEQKMSAIWQEPTYNGIVFRQFAGGIQCGESGFRNSAGKKTAGGMFLPV